MSIEEIRKIEDLFIPYEGLGKMKTFHNRESGEVVVVIYDPNILGITKLKDILTLSPEALRNLNLYFKTRDEKLLEGVLRIYRKYKENNSNIIEIMTPLIQTYNEILIKTQNLVEQSK